MESKKDVEAELAPVETESKTERNPLISKRTLIVLVCILVVAIIVVYIVYTIPTEQFTGTSAVDDEITQLKSVIADKDKQIDELNTYCKQIHANIAESKANHVQFEIEDIGNDGYEDTGVQEPKSKVKVGAELKNLVNQPRTTNQDLIDQRKELYGEEKEIGVRGAVSLDELNGVDPKIARSRLVSKRNDDEEDNKTATKNKILGKQKRSRKVEGPELDAFIE